MINKYVSRSKISEAKFRQLVSYFALNLSATQIAQLSGLNRTTVNRLLDGIRRVIEDKFISENTLFYIPENITVSEKLPCGIILIHEQIHLCVNKNIYTECNVILESTPFLPQFLYDTSTSGFIKLDNAISETENGLLFSFIQSVKHHQQICYGIPEKKVIRHLCELIFRFNYRNQNKYDILLKWIRHNPI
ncbi:hypothetical protein EP331_10020 [bacterium]|nr:MAG: hypothetical protein EP331_10020 [bacterium]